VYWTHLQALEDLAVFFWGAYGMGWLAWYARTRWSVLQRTLVWLALGTLCALFDAKGRALTAWGVSVLLLLMPVLGSGLPQAANFGAKFVRWLSRISYPVFVVHFGVTLVVNAKVSSLWPSSTIMNGLGMVAALLLSLWAGDALHRLTERGPVTWRRWMAWMTTFMASTGLAIWLAS
jgi:peptidoglycan/LPS O-acetylase OafA/YrhL